MFPEDKKSELLLQSSLDMRKANVIMNQLNPRQDGSGAAEDKKTELLLLSSLDMRKNNVIPHPHGFPNCQQVFSYLNCCLLRD